MAQLWAVDGDENSEGGGGLKANTGDSAPGTVFINNLAVIVGTTDASPDDKSPDIIDGGLTQHDNPQSDKHSATVFAYNKPAHRNGDSRTCGATTVVTHESTVFVGG
jgi:hypothetical protein